MSDLEIAAPVCGDHHGMDPHSCPYCELDEIHADRQRLEGEVAEHKSNAMSAEYRESELLNKVIPDLEARLKECSSDWHGLFQKIGERDARIAELEETLQRYNDAFSRTLGPEE